jgi:hypothetical protein
MVGTRSNLRDIHLLSWVKLTRAMSLPPLRGEDGGLEIKRDEASSSDRPPLMSQGTTKRASLTEPTGNLQKGLPWNDEPAGRIEEGDHRRDYGYELSQAVAFKAAVSTEFLTLERCHR